MSDTLKIFGTTYTNVTGIKALTPEGVIMTYTSGSGDELELDDVNFFDYDGTLLHKYTKSEFLALNSLPDLPTHDGFTTQEWNWNLVDAKAQVTELGYCDIGAIVCPSDGKTHIVLEVPEVMSAPYIVKGDPTTSAAYMSVDWGDGSPVETSSAGTGTKTLSHTYAAAGTYEILIDSNGTLTNFLPYGLRNENTQYKKMIRKVHLGTAIKYFGQYALQACDCEVTLSTSYSPTSNSHGQGALMYTHGNKFFALPSGCAYLSTNIIYEACDLKYISLPLACVNISLANCRKLKRLVLSKNAAQTSYNFSSCTALETLILPNGITTVSKLYGSMYNLKTYNIPTGLTSLPASANAYAMVLREFSVPEGVTTMGNSVFDYCLMLEKVTLPSSLTTIGNGTFTVCNALKEIHIKATTPPTLGTGTFSTGINVNTSVKIYVPYSADHSILEAYQNATNWAAYTSIMVEEPA